MNINAIGLQNTSWWLVLGGIALLLLNILFGLFGASRGDIKAGKMTVVLVLLACSLVVVGSVQVASAATTTIAPRIPRNGSTTATADPASVVTATPQNPAATPAVNLTSPTDSTAPSTTPTRKTGQGQRSGTPGATTNISNVRGPVAAAVSTSTGGATGTYVGTNAAGVSATNSAAAPSSTSVTSASSTDNPSGVLLLILGGISILLAIGLYFVERRRPAFTLTTSRGVLNIGGAVFIVVALQIIPMIPAQLSSGNQLSAATRAAGGFPTRSVITATPTATAFPTSTPTVIPTFTPRPAYIPAIQPTPIVYLNTTAQPLTATADGQMAALQPAVACQVTATNNLNLRSDPSTDHPLLLTIPAGTILPVSGHSPDKFWWKISYSTSIGWVSAQYTTNNGKCVNIPTLQQ